MTGLLFGLWLGGMIGVVGEILMYYGRWCVVRRSLFDFPNVAGTFTTIFIWVFPWLILMLAMILDMSLEKEWR